MTQWREGTAGQQRLLTGAIALGQGPATYAHPMAGLIP
jgi:hypothetical protein